MRIRARPSRRSLERITLNLASMIDVTFLLLVYFMVTMVFAASEDKLSPTVQTRRDAAAGESADFQPQRVQVRLHDGRPAFLLNERVIDGRAALADALRPLPKSVGIFVIVFDGVPVDVVAQAIQVARDAGFEQVTYVPASGL